MRLGTIHKLQMTTQHQYLEQKKCCIPEKRCRRNGIEAERMQRERSAILVQAHCLWDLKKEGHAHRNWV